MGERVIEPILNGWVEKHPCVGEVRGVGLFWAIELVKDKATREPLVPFNASGADAAPMAAFVAACKASGLWPFAHFNRTHVCPPLVITEDELRRGLAIIDEAADAASTRCAVRRRRWPRVDARYPFTATPNRNRLTRMTSLDVDIRPSPAAPRLPQERKLVTAIPGPRSLELMERKAAAVAAGVGHTAPISAVAAGGGVVVDADGNSLIDLGSGIAVTGVGNSHPAVVAAIQAQAAQFTHTCFMVSPYEGYVAVAEALNRVTPGDFAKKSALFNSGAEAVENAVKIARKFTGQAGGRRLRPRVSRPHQPHDGAHRQVDAVQERLWPLRRGGLPRADVVSVSRRAQRGRGGRRRRSR